jgi:hypothetical protein
MPSTIRDLSELTAVAPDDYLVISDTSDVTNRDKRISKANLVGATITGGGTIALGGFTFTVPATGTPSLLGTAQPFTALKTFSAGLSFGQSTMNYYEYGAWPTLPAISGSGGAPTATYSAQEAYFMRLGIVCFFTFYIAINTISGGSGNLRIANLPFPVGNQTQQPRCYMFIDGVVIPGTAPFAVAAFGLAGTTNLAPIVYQNNAAIPQLLLSAFGAGDSVTCSGFYLL